jgi:eukaryotic-like serine/threonine-protein kinase
MSLAVGVRFGPYEILSLIGVGGMGEVYKGRDRRLDRTVAIKLLPVEMADRADRRARFETEARAISSLSHPHICTLFDVGEENGQPFLVMEHLEGETLNDRLMRGALPADEVMRYAMQIADALSHAHRGHIVHRDLKPSNVMLTSAGVKLLDFGLARRSVIERSDATMSTLSFDQRKLTAEGTILGTFQYMAPEQLEGKEADVRTDIFAFGTLLYEMATGRKAFEGTSQASLIASILTGHPPAISSARMNEQLPAGLDHVVERCLAKNPDNRWQTARDLKLELEWIVAGGGGQSEGAVSAKPRARRREVMAWAAAVLATLVAVATALVGIRDPPQAEPQRFVVAPPAGVVIPLGEQRTRVAVSPDGRHLAFSAFTEGRLQLFVRSLASLEARPLPGTEGGVSPFWSHDSRYIGFFAPGTGELKKIDPSGGGPRTICSAEMEGLAEWGADNTILFSATRDGIYRVSADGGTPARVTSIDKTRREINHYWPSFLPDGRHFMYLATANETEITKATPSVYIAAFDGTDRKLLERIHSRVVYAPPGYLLFEEEGNLLAQAFDLAALRLIGDATRIADNLAVVRTIGNAHFSVSATGTLVYLGSGDAYEVVWFDRRGNATPTGWAKQEYGGLRISPDAQEAAADIYDPRSGTADVWIYDLVRNVPRRFTADRVSERAAVWSPDSRRILFTTERGGSPNLFTKALDGSGDVQTVVRHPGPIFAEDWSPDARLIAYSVGTLKTGNDLWLKPLEGDQKEYPFLNSRFEELNARFSPDSNWLAFVSNETSALPEIYIAPVGLPGQRKQLSIGGGTAPRWRRDGKELFYMSVDNRSVMAVPIESLRPFKPGIPARLFTIGADTAATRERARTTVYDVMPDGQRFLISVPAGEAASSRITVVLNWASALKQ